MPRLLTFLALLISATVSAPAWSASSASEPVRHTVVLGGSRAGVQTATVGADGVREVTFEFNDRGRGPKLTARIKLNEAGVPVAVQTSGNDYLKAAVNETFTLENGVARWKNDAESAE